MKLLKLLASKMDEEERTCLPLLLNVFYYRETLFIVYELLRDNLYHMCRRRRPPPPTPPPSPSPCCARTVGLTSAARTASPATSTSRSAGCQNTSRCAPTPCMRRRTLGGAPRPPSHPTLYAVHGRSIAQVERLQEVARQCLRTLHCLHQHEVIHCDLVRHAPTRNPCWLRLPTCLPCRSNAETGEYPDLLAHGMQG